MTEGAEGVADRSRSSFIRVTCPDCGTQRVTFSHATTTIDCEVCGANIGKPTGGKLKLRNGIVEVEVLP